jgi:predicted RNase H-like HicB family nuclease
MSGCILILGGGSKRQGERPCLYTHKLPDDKPTGNQNRILTMDEGRFTVRQARLAPEMISTPGHRASRRRQREAVVMKPDKNMKLADLMYGHGSKFMSSLSGRFDPKNYSDAPPIQICEMECGCWIVADGNNRVGLILMKNPEATIADIPERLLETPRVGEWDAEMMDWWNPGARSFREVMGKRGKKAPAPKNSIYGIIERDGEGKFIASIHGLKKVVAPFATGRTPDEAKRLLEDKLKIMLETESVSLVLTPLTPLEDHQCSLLRSSEN